jgi:hypothetical protein
MLCVGPRRRSGFPPNLRQTLKSELCENSSNVQRFYLGIASLLLMVLGVFLSFGAYQFPLLLLNYPQVAGSLFFWAGAFILVTTFLLGSAPRLAFRYAKTPGGLLVGGAYLAFHVLLYGFILEGILVTLYGSPPFATSPLVFFSTNLYDPASLANAVLGITFSPSITVLIPPFYEASLSLFSIFAALVIDILILANVGEVARLGSFKAAAVKARAYMVMPLTGIALGASCCMSIPILLSIADPALTFLSSLEWVYYLTYYAFPALAAVVLKLNLDLATRTVARATQLVSSPLPD